MIIEHPSGKIISEESIEEFDHNGWIIEIDPSIWDFHWTAYPKCKRDDKDCWEYTMQDSLAYNDKFYSFDESFQDAMRCTEISVNDFMNDIENPKGGCWDENAIYIPVFRPKFKKVGKKYKREPRGELQRAWKLMVVYRDKKCQYCGSITDLEAHHIKSYQNNIELRFNLDNGITLCNKCHREYHKINGK